LTALFTYNTALSLVRWQMRIVWLQVKNATYVYGWCKNWEKAWQVCRAWFSNSHKSRQYDSCVVPFVCSVLGAYYGYDNAIDPRPTEKVHCFIHCVFHSVTSVTDHRTFFSFPCHSAVIKRTFFSALQYIVWQTRCCIHVSRASKHLTIIDMHCTRGNSTAASSTIAEETADGILCTVHA